MTQSDHEEAVEMNRLALDLTVTAGRFSQVVGRVPGVQHSAIAWRVLSELQRRPARVGDLAQHQRITQPSMTSLVTRLESEGWAERRPDPDDGRAALVVITDAGRAALAEYRSAAAGLVRPGLERLSDFDRATLARAVELMRQLVDEADTGP